jgi:hypothetical protein
MKLALVYTFLLAHLSVNAQLTSSEIQNIESLSKTIMREDGFYRKTVDYLKNKPKYLEDAFELKLKEERLRRAKNNPCKYYKLVLPTTSQYDVSFLARRSRCIVKNNELYIKHASGANTFVKALIPGYFCLTACSPQPSNGAGMGLLGYAATTSYRDYKKGSLFNMGLYRPDRFTPFNLRNILSNYPTILAKYKKEKLPESLEVMVQYLIKLNDEILRTY